MSQQVKILAFRGSPRKGGNSTLLLNELVRGAAEAGGTVEEIAVSEVNIRPCRGCLRCNLAGRCAIRGDEWSILSERILNADVLVFASPIYFHHFPGPLKNILDRFRSFLHVRITEDELIHTPRQQWRKQFILLLSSGSPGTKDAQPVIDLFSYLTHELGEGNRLSAIVGTRLAVAGQVGMGLEDLRSLYRKLQIPDHLADQDHQRNQMHLKQCYEMGREIGRTGKAINPSIS